MLMRRGVGREVRGSVRECEGVWGSVRECEGVWGSVRECEGVWGSVRECEGVWGSVRECEGVWGSVRECEGVWGSVRECEGVWGSVRECEGVWGSVRECEGVWGSVRECEGVWGSDRLFIILYSYTWFSTRTWNIFLIYTVKHLDVVEKTTFDLDLDTLWGLISIPAMLILGNKLGYIILYEIIIMIYVPADINSNDGQYLWVFYIPYNYEW